MQFPDGSLQEKTKGVMQGGVISPVLSNLFLHYVFDVWMKRNHQNVPWCRYADDALAHCETEEAAQELLVQLKERFKDCGLELHPDKTKIVYCKDDNRLGNYRQTEFVFLGYSFRRREAKNSKNNKLFLSFNAAVSAEAMKSMRAKTRQIGFSTRTDISLEDIAQKCNPILQGWINYYGRYNPSALQPVFRHFNKSLVTWAMRKFKKLKRHKTKALVFMEEISKKQPQLFAHWGKSMGAAFA